eukprot:701821-Pelagomonas_calceolata.AAC.3
MNFVWISTIECAPSNNKFKAFREDIVAQSVPLRMFTCVPQAFDLLSSPGSKQVILCGSNFATSSSDAAAQQLSGWQWWQQGDQDRSEKLEDALEAEGGLSWHADFASRCGFYVGKVGIMIRGLYLPPEKYVSHGAHSNLRRAWVEEHLSRAANPAFFYAQAP